MRYGLAAGGFEPKKHSDLEACARAEMAEEACLKDGKMISLLDRTSEGISELKWSRNTFIPFLCVDPVPDEQPPMQDDEELVHYLDIDVEEFNQVCLRGEMMLTGVQTGLMAISKLKKLNVFD
jgi:hypothetical protein